MWFLVYCIHLPPPFRFFHISPLFYRLLGKRTTHHFIFSLSLLSLSSATDHQITLSQTFSLIFSSRFSLSDAILELNKSSTIAISRVYGLLSSTKNLKGCRTEEERSE